MTVVWQFKAKVCLVCHKNCPPSVLHIPIISVGKHCTLAVCKKGHLMEPLNQASIIMQITNIL
jgi:hypothetical protein